MRYGIRWKDGRNVYAAQLAALLPDKSHEATAWEELDDPDHWDWWDFEQDWFQRLVFFVQFNDQRGDRWENVLVDGDECEWASSRI